MPELARPRVQLIAWTQFAVPDGVDWTAETADGSALAEFAGRSCYQAWDRSNPATSTNAGYLRHVIEVGHHAVLEHASATFYLTGISRSLAAELTRHRQFSFSELSPRHVPAEPATVVPAELADHPELREAFLAGVRAAERAHQSVLSGLQAGMAQPEGAGLRGKQLRQAARTLLPGATATTLVMTGNYRAWRALLAAHGADHADREMRGVIAECLQQLTLLAPAAFGDFSTTSLSDGSVLIASPLAGS
ncbi:MAG TPA: FAD-dependent thymidylate synthase [Jatrophihabitans sp.]|nr:FAD-dependent thymidylate synthase [Jatrophihabitans sp.]